MTFNIKITVEYHFKTNTEHPKRKTQCLAVWTP